MPSSRRDCPAKHIFFFLNIVASHTFIFPWKSDAADDHVSLPFYVNTKSITAIAVF